ncbi:hypothetical protein AB5J62_29790 [Amycolatopsis sp. cg5]|uniref:hypothetical protein n=1 Tax=Amycolatopsis sp. cg5 TaxID=3238802 RepID=UPI0035246DA8
MTHRNQIRLAHYKDVGTLVEARGDRVFVNDRLDRQALGLGWLLTTWSGEVLLGSMYVWLEDAEEAELREKLPGCRCSPGSRCPRTIEAAASAPS